jgi:thiaminase/transcriptional activator TenA
MPSLISLSDRILQENQDIWIEMQNHRFVRDIERDQLAPDVFRRYLVYEGRSSKRRSRSSGRQ